MAPLIVKAEGPAIHRVRGLVFSDRLTAPLKMRAWPSMALIRRRSPAELVKAPDRVIGKVPPKVAGSPPKVSGVVMASAEVRARSERSTPPLKLNAAEAPNCATPEFLLSTNVPCVSVVAPV